MSTKRFILSSVAGVVLPAMILAAGVRVAAASPEATGANLVELVRQATAQFREAPPTGYGEFLGCVSGPDHGAMGVHFVNPSLLGDGVVDVNHPEALIYERRNGHERLVGVEFIVPVDTWHSPQPPVLEGQVFQFVPAPNRFELGPFYELHVWAWRENPLGAYADWNNNVTCEGQ